MSTKSLFAPGAAGRWPTISLSRPRQEGAAPPANPAAPPASTVDFSNPEIQAAIAAAAQKTIGERQTAWEDEKAKIIANRDAILTEKKGWEPLGKPEEVAARLKKLEELETAAKAKEIGAEPDKFSQAVEAAAQAKYQAREQELSAVTAKAQERINELETANRQLEEAAHRAFVKYEIARACVPKDARIIHDGAHEQLVSILSPLTVRKEIPGMSEPIAQFKKGGALIPGGGPEGYMTMNELLALMRQGKDPIPDAAYYFVSQGQGSGTTPPSPGNNGGSKALPREQFNRMDPAAQMKWVKDGGTVTA